MRKRLVRMFPDVPNIASLLQKRQQEASNAADESSPENPPTSDNESQKEYANVCRCRSTRSRSSETREECPVELDPMSCTHPDLAIRRAMEYYACYLPNTKDDYRCELVHQLALSGQNKEKEFIEHIDSSPESVTARDSAGNTPLILACSAYLPSKRIVEILLASAPREYVNAENEHGFSALHYAVLNNQPELVAKLLQHDADPDAGKVMISEDESIGLTPVIMCLLCRSAYPSLVCLNVLLQYNPDLSVTMAKPAQASDGVHFFVECGCGGCSSRKVLSHSSVLPPTKIGSHPWTRGGDVTYLAVRFGYIPDAEVLLDKHQEYGQLFHALYLPTHKLTHSLFTVAADYLHPEMMKALLRRNDELVNVGAPGPLNDRRRNTTLHHMLSKQRFFANEYVCLYCGKKIRPDPSIVQSVFNVMLDCPSLVVTAANDHGETYLYLACKHGHDYVCEKLLALGADPSLMDQDGNDSIAVAMMFLKTDLCLKVLKILFKTGVAHYIYHQDSFPASKTLLAFLKRQDREVLKLFWKVGALSETNRMRMLEALEMPLPYKDEAARNRGREFQTALLQLSPLKLSQVLVLHLSKSVGYQKPCTRLGKMKDAIREIAGDMVGITEADSKDGKQTSNDASQQGGTLSARGADGRVEDVGEDQMVDSCKSVESPEGDRGENSMDFGQSLQAKRAWGLYCHLFEFLGLE